MSRLPGFHKLSVAERRQQVIKACNLDSADDTALGDTNDAMASIADQLIENAIGTYPLPLGIATNMLVDGDAVLVPMVTEESSVVAAVCNGARQCHSSGGVFTTHHGQGMIGQIQIKGISNPHAAAVEIRKHEDEILDICNACDPRLVQLGGGYRGLKTRVLDGREPQLILHLIVDTLDAMGANSVNTMAEKLAPQIESWSGGKVGLKILSNLADERVVQATAIWSVEDLDGSKTGGSGMNGESVRDAMLAAAEFAQLDPYRATTHNKGIMNGVSAVVLATGNDTRAVEAGAHAFAARNGHYAPLTFWERNNDGALCGTIEMPMAVGIVGGATKIHPTAQLSLKMMNVNNARRLASIIAAVGLVQNFSALKALATEGIQRGHMSLHAKNIAIAAGAQGAQVDRVANKLIELGTIREDVAEDILKEL